MGHARRYALAMMNLCLVEGLGSVSRKGKKHKDEKERRYTKGVIATLTLTAKRTVPRNSVLNEIGAYSLCGPKNWSGRF